MWTAAGALANAQLAALKAERIRRNRSPPPARPSPAGRATTPHPCATGAPMSIDAPNPTCTSCSRTLWQ
ncbi:hypothetical protein KBZ21_36135, partial [Streptomyces sp. A73]|nr:hypothetical protein [Streptomyces sp. A73]